MIGIDGIVLAAWRQAEEAKEAKEASIPERVGGLQIPGQSVEDGDLIGRDIERTLRVAENVRSEAGGGLLWVRDRLRGDVARGLCRLCGELQAPLLVALGFGEADEIAQ